MAEGVVDDISHEGLRALLREECVTFQRLKTWKTSADPDYAVKEAASSTYMPSPTVRSSPIPAEPEVIFCLDEFGPPNLQPRPGRQWAASAARTRNQAAGHGRGGAPPIPAPPGCGTCSPPMSWARTSCMGVSSRARTGPGSWSSALSLPAAGADCDHLRLREQGEELPERQSSGLGIT